MSISMTSARLYERRSLNFEVCIFYFDKGKEISNLTKLHVFRGYKTKRVHGRNFNIQGQNLL